MSRPEARREEQRACSAGSGSAALRSGASPPCRAGSASAWRSHAASPRTDPRASRRAARRARPQAARAHEARTQELQGAIQHHLSIYHAPPVRRRRHVGPDRGHEPGPLRAESAARASSITTRDAIRRKLRRRDEPLVGGGRTAGEGVVAVRLPSGASVSGRGVAMKGPALCFVRPEAVALAHDRQRLGDMANRFSGRVSAVLFDGANRASSSRRRNSPSDAGGLP